MSDSFDPYYRWLGIPPKDQPPDHYRLLSVERFETHADVIAEAADRQMAHLRTRQSGQHADLAARLLNEIAAARVCLLSPAKKAAYDAELAKAIPAQQQPASNRHWTMIAAGVLFCLMAAWLVSAVWTGREEITPNEVLASRSGQSTLPSDPAAQPSSSELRPNGVSATATQNEKTSNSLGKLPGPDLSGHSALSQKNSSQRVSTGIWRPLDDGQGSVKPLSKEHSSTTAAESSSDASLNSTSQKPAPAEVADPGASNAETVSDTPSVDNSVATNSPTAESVPSKPVPAGEVLPASKEVACYSVGKNPLQSFAISANGQRIVTRNVENQLSLLDLKAGSEIQTLTGADLNIEHLAMVPNGRFFMASGLTADDDFAQMRTYRSRDGAELTVFASANGPVTALAISANGLQFASGHRLGIVSLNPTQTTAAPILLYTRQRAAEITALAFSSDNQQLVFGDRSGGVHVALISSKKPNVQQHLDAHTTAIQALSITSHGDLLLSAAADGSIAVWQDWRGRDPAKAKLKFFTGTLLPDCAAISPEGNLIATANETGEITLWDANSGKPMSTLAGHTAAIIGLAFLPEGQQLVSASRDATVRVWNCTVK